MKPLLSIAIVFLLAATAVHGQTPTLVQHTIALKWEQDFTGRDVCTNRLKASCISGFVEGYVEANTRVRLHTDGTFVCSGNSEPESCTVTFNSNVPTGDVVFYVETEWIDKNGNIVPLKQMRSSSITVTADPTQKIDTVLN